MSDSNIDAAIRSLTDAGASIWRDDDALSVSFEDCSETSIETLRELTRISRLEKICFFGTPVDGSILKQMTCNQTLRSLNLNCTSVSAADCVLISRFPRLESIGLMNTLADDSCIDSLLRCDELWNLRIDGTQISPAGLTRLVAKLPLRCLWIGGRQITIESMTAVEAHLTLDEFNICGADVSDKVISTLAPLRRQRTVLNHTALTRTGRAKLKRRFPHILVNS